MCSSSAQHYRGGKLMWNRAPDDNTVVFIFAGTFTRSFLGFRSGLGAGSQSTAPPNVGDTIVLSGKEPIRFKPGESAAEEGVAIRLRVTEIDEGDDWLKGEWTHTHTYRAANNGGMPWAARVVGCCRFAELKHHANTPFQLIASVDLTWVIGFTQAKGSGKLDLLVQKYLLY